MPALTAPATAALTLPRNTPAFAVASWSLAQVTIFLVPMVVLGMAIGWPASLRYPPAEVLPLIRRQASAVTIGYGAYLLASVAMVPLVFALRGWLAELGRTGWIIDTLTFLGAAAGILKTLGIVRWLSVMPALAEAHAAADPMQRLVIETTYMAINAYAGAVGELLGVQLLSGLWFAGAGHALWSARHRLLGGLAVVVGVAFLLVSLRVALPAFAGIQAVAVPGALLWLILLGVSALRAPHTEMSS